ncbi:dehydrogenase [Rhodobacteraceae bacterium (ex Bugula neritina AB1)]|nr:dehydrogenase [Rhodobacteraceae bacterium (ex Bugula neritina AB1)]
MPQISAKELETLACAYLTDAGAAPGAAAQVARAMVQAETEGNPVCGLYYLTVFKEQMALGKVDGQAEPSVLSSVGSAIMVDAVGGFAHPAIRLATNALITKAREQGIAAAGITRSYNALSLAHHVLPLAEAGLIGLCCSNAPASVAPPGGTAPLFGTNPMAFAVPGSDGPAVVIDQSASAVTKTAILMREKAGGEMPLGWAQDRGGQPTQDPAAGLAGSLLPYGGQKGANIGLMVEILAAALTGAQLSTQAPSFSGQDTGTPGVGQFLLAIDPAHFSGAQFAQSLTRLAGTYDAADVRLPGSKFRTEQNRPALQMITIDTELLAELRAVPKQSPP